MQKSACGDAIAESRLGTGFQLAKKNRYVFFVDFPQGHGFAQYNLDFRRLQFESIGVMKHMAKAPQLIEHFVSRLRNKSRTYTWYGHSHSIQQLSVPTSLIRDLIFEMIGGFLEKVLKGAVEIVQMKSKAFQHNRISGVAPFSLQDNTIDVLYLLLLILDISLEKN